MDGSTARPGTLILGLGNPLRADDGVGSAVVKALLEDGLPADVECVDGGTQGLGLVSLMEGRQRLIVVDAADVGEEPGRFVRFSLDEARLLGGEQQLSIHAAGLRDALLLAQALDVLPEDVIVFGTQPASLDWGDELSPEVQSAVPLIASHIRDEIRP